MTDGEAAAAVSEPTLPEDDGTAPPGHVLVEILAHGLVYRHYFPFHPSLAPGPAGREERLRAECADIAARVGHALANGSPLTVEWTASDTGRDVRATLLAMEDVEAVRVIHRDEWGPIG